VARGTRFTQQSGGDGSGSTVPVLQRLKRVQRLARLWDAAISVPGTRLRIGLDPLVGLVPGIGDAVGALVASYVLVEAMQFGVPTSVLLRMLANIAVDALLGTVPVIGDIFDVVWTANLRNVALLEQHVADPGAVHKASRRWLLVVAAALLLLVVGGLALGWLLTRALLRIL
jgi:hypothetical protein